MKRKLPDSVASLQDLTSLILELREYNKWYSHQSIKNKIGAKAKSETPTLSTAASEILREKPFDKRDLDAIIKELESCKKTLPSISITLAAMPTSKIKLNLVEWCRKNISPNILVNFEFNSNLLGGMVVKYGSRIFDWSFRRQLMAERNIFPEILRNVR